MGIAGLAKLPGTTLQAVSDVYETEPVGFREQPDFLNLTVSLTSTLAPQALLAAIQSIERDLGRERIVRFGPRTLDIDILLCDEQVILQEPELVIPHPRMHERAFVLLPLVQIAPAARHPLLALNVAQLCAKVEGKEGVRWHSKLLPNDCVRIESSKP